MATTDDIVTYYTDLLIIQYIRKPKARATIDAIVRPVIMDQLPTQVNNAFDIETAVGAQLDVLGKYTGVSRYSRTFTGPITLDDNDFRLIVKVAILKNNSGSDLNTIQTLIQLYFPDALRVFDYLGMRMSYFFDSAYGSVYMAEVLVREGLLPKPMGVQLGALIYMPNIKQLFCMRTYALEVVHGNGFNEYGDYQMTWPWLSYAYAILP